MESLKDALERIAALEQRIERLETLVVKPGGAPAEPRATEPPPSEPKEPEATELAFPELDADALYPPTDRLRPMSRSDTTSRGALERYPQVLEKISLLWGHPECVLLLERLFADGRPDRRGFEKDAIEEIMLLTDVCRDLAPPTKPR